MNEQPHTPTQSPWWKRSWLIAALLLFATLIAYQPAWNGQPIFDDHDHLTPPELSSVGGLWKIWTNIGVVSQYYPVTHSAFWLQHHLWGDSMLGYHLLNILLHALAAWLLGRILQQLAVPGAWLAAAIFALHPVHAESVAWISELKNTLSGACYLGAALAYLSFDRDRGRKAYFVALGLFLLGVLSKGVIASLPAALLVVFWWKRGKLSWRNDVQPLLPFFAIGIAGGLLTAWVERKFIGAEGEAFALTLMERSLVAGRALWFYLGKLLWPVDLVFVYPRWEVSQAVLWQYVFPIAAVAFVIALWLLRRRMRGPLAAALFFGGTLFPALGFLNVYPFIYSFVADHYQYLASIGVITAVAAGIALLLQRQQLWARPAGNVICVALVGTLAVLTWRQSRIYADTETLWTATIAENPACWVGHSNLGNYFYQQGKIDDAIRHTRRALELRPDLAEAHNNLGNALRQQGRADEAMRHYEQAVAIRPDLAQAHYNIGVLLSQRGDSDAALARFEKAIELRPEYVSARNNAGSILLDRGEVDAALVHIRRALDVMPNDPTSHNNLANALLRQGDVDLALAHYRKAIAAEPDNTTALNNLGHVLLQQGRLDEAMGLFQQALKAKPDLAHAHANLANVYVQKQQIREAIFHFRKSLETRPNDPATHNDLGSALLAAGQEEEAVAHFLKAVEIKPDYEFAQLNLGYLLLHHGNVDEAIVRLRSAVTARPDLAPAHYQLANALLQKGEISTAITHFQKTLELDPGFPNALNDLGVAWIQAGSEQEAIKCFQKVLEAQPDSAEAHNNLGKVLAQTGRGQDALTHYKAALNLQKDNPDTLINFAWLLATSPDQSVRNGQHAIFLAQRANQLATEPHPVALRTLAAAFAEAGRFGDAAEAARQALALATAHSDTTLVTALQAQLALYEAGSPFREAAAEKAGTM